MAPGIYNGSETYLSGGKEQPPYRHLTMTGQTIVTTFYLIGVAGNLAALGIILSKKNTTYRNRKHALMLTCLAGNDLVALLGMLVQMYLQLYLPLEMSNSHLSCVFRLLWRVFGLGSGCVAIVMAVERWLALSHPFFYQKNVTYHSLLKAILCLWTAALTLVCTPLLGFGLYFNSVTSHCMRYRLATTPLDIAYAYVFFAFGLLLCTGISFANLSVTRTLCLPSSRFNVRRISRSLSRSWSTKECADQISTRNEVAFARLMVAFSISFLVCWLPQLVSIPIAQTVPKSKASDIFFRAADILIALHFTLDPYIYVLLHHQFPCLKITFELVHRHCCCLRSSGAEDTQDTLTTTDEPMHMTAAETSNTFLLSNSKKQLT